MQIDMKTVGARIKQRRTELSLKHMDIKDAVGISSGNLSELENGNRAPSMVTLYKLSKVLKCSIDWIVTGESPMSENSFSPIEGDSKRLLFYFEALDANDQEELLLLAELKYNKLTMGRPAKSSHFENNDPGSETA
jgi:transcriptional regulator with XRE-family HTH domain